MVFCGAITVRAPLGQSRASTAKGVPKTNNIRFMSLFFARSERHMRLRHPDCSRSRRDTNDRDADESVAVTVP
jgi:hypothetical protein